MARPLNPDTGRLELRADPKEIKSWAKCADAEDRPLASWVRRELNSAAEKCGKTGRRKKIKKVE